MKADVAIGMFFSQLIMWAIIVTTAGSLHNQGITDVQTSEQVAKALEPVVKSFPYSGQIAKIIFALGIIGTGLLAVPVLAGDRQLTHYLMLLGGNKGSIKSSKKQKPST